MEPNFTINEAYGMGSRYPAERSDAFTKSAEDIVNLIKKASWDLEDLKTVPSDQRVGPSSDEFYKFQQQKSKQASSPVAEPEVVAAQVVSQPKPKKPQFKTLGDLIDFNPTNGDDWEMKRSAVSKLKRSLLQDAFRYYSQAGLPASEIGKAMEVAEKQIEREGLVEDKPWTESTAYKSFNDYFGRAGYQQNAFTLGVLKNTIIDARQMLQDGRPKEEVTSFLKANVPKVIQSLGTGQSDAIQQPEWLRVASELNTIFNTNITDWPGLLQDKDKISGLFSSDPLQFMNKAERVYDAARKHFNRHYEASVKVNGKRMTDTIAGADFFDSISNNPQAKDMTKAEAILRNSGIKPFASSSGDPQAYLKSINQSRNRGSLQFGGIKTFDVPAEAPQ